MLLLLLTIIGLGVLVILFTRSKERYLSIDPIDTGIEREIWGPLYTLPNRNRGRYMAMHHTPWCVNPQKEECMCNLMIDTSLSAIGAPICGPEVPYQCNKI